MQVLFFIHFQTKRKKTRWMYEIIDRRILIRCWRFFFFLSFPLDMFYRHTVHIPIIIHFAVYDICRDSYLLRRCVESIQNETGCVRFICINPIVIGTKINSKCFAEQFNSLSAKAFSSAEWKDEKTSLIISKSLSLTHQCSIEKRPNVSANCTNLLSIDATLVRNAFEGVTT